MVALNRHLSSSGEHRAWGLEHGVGSLELGV